MKDVEEARSAWGLWGNARLLRALLVQARQRRPAGAYLLCGPEGVGKRHAALAFARTINCQGSPPPCGECDSCRALRLGVHPEVRLVEPDRGLIRIEAIRELQGWALLRARPGMTKVAVLDGADRMNAAAANCLLKLLEEPPPGTVLFLVSAEPHRLPATVVSRCQPYRFRPLRRQEVVEVLRERGVEPAEELAPLAMGRPGRLLRMIETGELERRRRWAECLSRGEGRELVEEACSDPEAFLEFLQEWLRDRLMEALEMPEACLWPGRAPGRGGGGARLAELVWEVHRCRGLLERNVNRRLLMEHLLVEVGA